MAKPGDKSFKQAFAEARKQLGPGKTFTWNGKVYTTNYKEEASSASRPTPRGATSSERGDNAQRNSSAPRPKARPVNTAPESSPRPKSRPEVKPGISVLSETDSPSRPPRLLGGDRMSGDLLRTLRPLASRTRRVGLPRRLRAARNRLTPSRHYRPHLGVRSPNLLRRG